MAFKVGRCLLPDILDDLGWTNQDLALKTGYSRQRISDWCRNRYVMHPKNMKTIAVAVRKPMESLYEWIEVEEEGGKE
ncbi:helix-turn-helix transcriptional regulator [Brevibacillus reuszeri]|uniref:helix-turn-helix transcriptional regulator n=1 Tax=Brevibacillus reuszeri TaxID=54915 RepID=UPI000CCC926D|nr:helix-turn-helix transcriptional regulator [Brevibacillus reuszeri]